MDANERALEEVTAGLRTGGVVPYLGPGMLALAGGPPVPASPLELVATITAKASVPHKIRQRLTQAAQFIENFKHRKTLVARMDEAFTTVPEPGALHRAIARFAPPLVVDTWYDDTMRAALAATLDGGEWGELQGLSQSEHFGTWTRAYDAAGRALDAPDPDWRTVLYRPMGGRRPASNYLVSDADFVEVLTEIDIQTPIPPVVQALRSGRGFLFLGCRFDDQLWRAFARQVTKRSSARHWAVLPDPLTRMEARFLAEQSIGRIEAPLPEVARALAQAVPA